MTHEHIPTPKPLIENTVDGPIAILCPHDPLKGLWSQVKLDTRNNWRHRTVAEMLVGRARLHKINAEMKTADTMTWSKLMALVVFGKAERFDL